MTGQKQNLSPFFLKSKIKTPIWGRIPLDEMNSDQIVQFVDELSDAVTALSIEGFSVVYDMVDEPMIEIRSVNI